ncbi:hypothetical protein CJ030_MR5G009752 [Morella rubra]|uniref:Uncharacterized protein n=1 Tax=Morella rubra TaxID=262757 RepID=A0A6A1VP91_9ROSI|nr:hypothetical protein CJ030_MR5G009752 [Morella rubra]
MWPITLKEFMWFYTPIYSSQVSKLWYFCPRNQRVSPITSYPDNNKGWHEHYFFMSGVGWERFPDEDHQSDSSLCWVFGFVPEHYRREVTSLTSMEQVHVDVIARVSPIDWNALLCKENKDILGYIVPEPPLKGSPSSQARKVSHDCSSCDDSRKGSSRFSLGGASSKWRHSREAEGSSHRPSSKKRKTSPPVASKAEEEDEVPLGRKSSKHRTNSGFEDIPRMFSPISGVHMEVANPEVRDIHEAQGIMQSLSHAVSLVAAFDAAELSHDEELESTRLKLQRLGELEAQKKLIDEVRTMARGAHSQQETYEARVVNFESEIASRDATIAELRQTVNELEQGRLDFVFCWLLVTIDVLMITIEVIEM